MAIAILWKDNGVSKAISHGLAESHSAGNGVRCKFWGTLGPRPLGTGHACPQKHATALHLLYQISSL